MKTRMLTWKRLIRESKHVQKLRELKGLLISTSATDAAMDPDLRQYQREMALSAIGRRYTPKKLAPLTSKPIYRKKKPRPLFDLDDEEEDEDAVAIRQAMQEIEDEELALAVQASLDQQKIITQGKASGSTPTKPSSSKLPQKSPRSAGFPNARRPSLEAEEVFAPSGLQTALSFAGTSTARDSFGQRVSGAQERSKSTFGAPSLLSHSKSPSAASNVAQVASTSGTSHHESLQLAEERRAPSESPPSAPISGFQALTDSEDEDEMEEVEVPVTHTATTDRVEAPSEVHSTQPAESPLLLESEEDDDMEEVEVSIPEPAPQKESVISASTPSELPPVREVTPLLSEDDYAPIPTPAQVASTSAHVADASTISWPSTPNRGKTPLFDWSRSPSPSASRLATSLIETSDDPALSNDVVSHEPDAEGEENPAVEEQQPEDEHWDAANEIDVHAEEGEFARFLSQVKGRNLNDVRKEIDDEIKTLNEQRKAAMRDSEDITQQMVSQIMVSAHAHLRSFRYC